jgi:hypothetical protein
MKEITLFHITLSGEVNVEAENSDEALDKAKRWVKQNTDKLTYGWTTKPALVKGAEE